jgi:hypothetical protein
MSTNLQTKFDALNRIAEILLEVDTLNKEKVKLEQIIINERAKEEVQWVQLGYSYEQMCGR